MQLNQTLVLNTAVQIAKENDYEEKIVFINKKSEDVKLPEKVDLLVHDLRGQLPLLGSNIDTIIDARTRFLKKTGVMIPQIDEIYAAIVESPNIYKKIINPWTKKYGLNQESAKKISLNNHHSYRIKEKELISNPSLWVKN